MAPPQKYDSCSRDELFSVGVDGLECINIKCVRAKLPRSGDCLPEISVCDGGCVCAGTPTEKKFVGPKPAGVYCDMDELFWPRTEGLVFEGGCASIQPVRRVDISQHLIRNVMMELCALEPILQELFCSY